MGPPSSAKPGTDEPGVESQLLEAAAEAIESAGDSSYDDSSNVHDGSVMTDSTESDDSEWDEIFGWSDSDSDSEWDDPSKWDYGRVDLKDSSEESLSTIHDSSDEHLIGVKEWADKQTDVSSKILLCLLDGMTPSQTASSCSVSESAVDSLLLQGLKDLPAVREDEFAYAFKSYDISLNEFIDIFGQPARTYRYLSLVHEQGAGQINDMLDDPLIPESAKINLRNRLKGKKAKGVTRIKHFAHARDKSADAAADGIPDVIDATHSSGVVAESDITLLDKSKLPLKESRKTGSKNHGKKSLGELGRRLLRDSVNDMAANCTEYSTDYFYNALPKVMADLGISSAKEFYEQMRIAFSGEWDVTFHEDRIVRFGDADRNDQMLRLLKKMSPVVFEDLAWQYRALYGVDSQLFKRWMLDYRQYFHDGVYDINYVKTTSLTDRYGGLLSAISSSGARTNTLGRTSAATAKPIHSKTAALDKKSSGSRDASSKGKSKPRISSAAFATKSTGLDSLVEAVLKLAKDDTEYSTNYFYRQLPRLAKRLGVNQNNAGTVHRQFYELFKRAFSGCENVTFPGAGFYVHFGTPDRNRQIYELLREMSPVEAVDLRREYEKRYGVGQSTLYGWFSCISKYRHGSTYSIPYKEDERFIGGSAVEDASKSQGSDPLGQGSKSLSWQAAAEQATPVTEPLVKSTVDLPERSENEPFEEPLDEGVRQDLIREAIDSVAIMDTEYSTDYFYETFSDLVRHLGVCSKTDFYSLVEKAYVGSDIVTFPMGHVMRYGDSDRDKQMLDLLHELSPVKPLDLAIAYERRYGFNRHLVKLWYQKLLGFDDFEMPLVDSRGYDSDAKNKSVKNSAASSFATGNDQESFDTKIDVKDTETVKNEPGGVGGKAANETMHAITVVEEAKLATTDERAEDKLPRPKSAVEWALSLEDPYRQVVQKVLFGNTLQSVAAFKGLSLEETSELIIDAVMQCPTVREDSYLMQYRLFKSMWEFCNQTGEPEVTFHFLYWRSRALDEAASHVAEGNNALSTSTDGRVDKHAASDMRRKLRAAAREAHRLDRIEPTKQMHMPQKPLQSSKGKGETTNESMSLVGRKLSSAESRGVITRRIVRAVDKHATLNREYSVGFFYRTLSRLMRDCGVHSERELNALLKQAYSQDRDVAFEDSDIIRFGNCDREYQLKALLAEYPRASFDSFAVEYSQRYGFDIERIAEWVKEYDLGLTVENSELLSSSLHAKSDGLANTVKLPLIDSPGSSGKTNNDVASSYARVGNTGRSVMGSPTVHAGLLADYEHFLRGELKSDCCDRRLIVERFHAKYPNGPSDPFSDYMLKTLGYKAKGKKLLFREDVSYMEYFERLIESRELFSRGDEGFENVIFNDPQFRQVLRRKMREFEVIEYERDSFIQVDRLCEHMGVRRCDISTYSQDVVRELRELQGISVPFTIWSLRNKYHVQHPLDVLATEGGVGEYLFETLFDIDPKVQCCTISKKRGFLETNGDFDTCNFIECLVEMNGPMEFDDLIDLLKTEYGISYPELALHHTVSMSSLYYDDLTDSVFNSRVEWEEMVNSELA